MLLWILEQKALSLVNEKYLDSSIGYFISENSCDIVIYRKKYVFGLCLTSWHKTTKNLCNFLSDNGGKCILCYVNEVTFEMPLGYLRMRKGW